jgi:hypothetical protein
MFNMYFTNISEEEVEEKTQSHCHTLRSPPLLLLLLLPLLLPILLLILLPFFLLDKTSPTPRSETKSEMNEIVTVTRP